MLTFFDIFGLLLILPIIRIILDSSIIYNNKYLSYFFTRFSFETETMFAIWLLSLVVLFFIIKNIVTYFGAKWQANIIFQIAAKLTSHQFELYLFKPFQFHTSKESGNLLRSIIEVPFNFANGILLPFVIIINELIVAILIFLAISIYSPYLFLSVVIFVTPFFIIYTIIHKNRLKKVSDQRDDSHTRMFAIGKLALDGFREIILFNKIDYFIESFRQPVNKFSRAFGTLNLYNSYAPRITESLAVFSIFCVFLTSYYLNYDMKIIGSFLAGFALASYRLIPSINKIILSYNNIKSSEFVFNHFEKTRIISDEFNNYERLNVIDKVQPLEFNECLEIKNLSFNYNDSTNKIFNAVNLKINKGETIGIIGDSGSGKTTLINILLLLLDEYSGEILVDGKVLNNESRAKWHKTISYVPQNVIIIAGTLQENITFGIPIEKIDNELLTQVIVQSQLKKFVDKLPHGVDTDIGEHGLKISGGQRQRIGIARALYHGGSILIFDEATSSLDKKTESRLTKSIQNLAKNNLTIIIIAHRLESLRYCDSIYGIVKGDIKSPLSFKDIS